MEFVTSEVPGRKDFLKISLIPFNEGQSWINQLIQKSIFGLIVDFVC